jgi:hypothetical protein
MLANLAAVEIIATTIAIVVSYATVEVIGYYCSWARFVERLYIEDLLRISLRAER